MKLLLSALLVVLGLSQTVEAKTKAPVSDAKVTEAKAAEKNRPPLDNTATGGITTKTDAKAPANTDGYNSLYPPAMYFSFQ
jgi:hypothetical protein